MVPIRGEWTEFADHEDKLLHYRQWGLVSPKAKSLCPVMCVDGFFDAPIPCEVVGYRGEHTAVIELEDGFHAIHGEHLAELQPRVPSGAVENLTRGTTFTEVLSDYIVLDIETTGLSRTNDDILEIATARYQYGKLVDEFHSFVKPTIKIPDEVTDLTGITQEDVENAPTPEEISPKLFAFIGNLPIIGHNILSFDIKFLSYTFCVQFKNPIIDTLIIAKDSFSLLPCHKLQYLKDTLQLESLDSHRALNDVYITNALLWACLAPKRYEARMFKAFLDNKLSEHKTYTRNARRNFSYRTKVNYKDISPTCSEIDSSSSLFGKTIAFTGSLSFSREEAMQMAVNKGAILKNSISSKLHYLVVGKQDLEIVGAKGMSSKEVKANELNQAGKAHICIITEAEFISLVAKGGPTT